MPTDFICKCSSNGVAGPVFLSHAKQTFFLTLSPTRATFDDLSVPSKTGFDTSVYIGEDVEHPH